MLQLKNQRSGSKTVRGISVILILKRIMTFRPKSPHILLNKNIDFNKSETEAKMKSPYTVLERLTLCFSLYKNCKLKIKLWWVGARERKKRSFFVSFILSERNFFKICISSQYIVYWIYFQNIYAFIYQKTLLHTLLLLVFKIV